MLQGSANIEYIQEGDKGLIAIHEFGGQGSQRDSNHAIADKQLMPSNSFYEP